MNKGIGAVVEKVDIWDRLQPDVAMQGDYTSLKVAVERNHHRQIPTSPFNQKDRMEILGWFWVVVTLLFGFNQIGDLLKEIRDEIRKLRESK